MGIVESVGRFLGRKKEYDEENGADSSRPSGVLPKIWRCHSSIYEAIKGLLQKAALFILYRKAAADADQILPIQNPTVAAISSTTPTIKDDDASSAESPHADQELQSTGEDTTTLQHHVVSSQHWPPGTAKPDTGKETGDHVIISIPSFKDSRAQARVEENNEITDVSSPGKGEEETPPVIVKRTVAVDEVRRIKHYTSRHRILLVGEGDFSFSAALAKAFGTASNIVSTSLDSKAFLKKRYGNATSNTEKIRSMGGKVMHGIDATQMADHPSLRSLRFDRIIFNFPFAGSFRNLSPESQLRRHRRLVSLFLKNAKQMLVTEDGEIHVTHKTNGNYVEWKVESIASSHGLKLIEAVKFKHLQYPGYNPKYWFRDGNFNCYPCKTYKFGLKDKPAL